MNYRPIQPFPNPEDYVFPELRALASIWQERRGTMEEGDAHKAFIKKLQREWAIETGIIERLYTLDRGITEILIEQGIESSLIVRGGASRQEAAQIQQVIDDHLGIIEGLFAYVKGEEPLTEYFIRGLQAKFTEHQNDTEALTESGQYIQVRLLKGEYKKYPNSPRRPSGEVHHYCPPEHTKEEMESLISMFRKADEDARYTPEVKSAWLHHRFTQIHPFQDGNGRVARALATLVFLRAGLFPLVVRDSDREEYIGALEAADAGDLCPLVTFFVRRQKEALLKALSIEQQTQQGNYTEQIIASAIEVLRHRLDREQQKVAVVYDHASKLFLCVKNQFKKRADTLNLELKSLTPTFSARTNAADNNNAEQRHYFHKQIIDIANRFDYFANIEPYHAWARITLSTGRDFDYVVSFHGYGYGEKGILGTTAFTYLKAPKEDGGTEPVELHPAAMEVFQFNYAESLESTEKRFAEWLEASMIIALAAWKRSL